MLCVIRLIEYFSALENPFFTGILFIERVIASAEHRTRKAELERIKSQKGKEACTPKILHKIYKLENLLSS